MKPIIIIPADVMSVADMGMLRENGLCVVVATDPSKVRFLDPIPAAQERTRIEHAAILMSRKLLNGAGSGHIWSKKDFSDFFISFLLEGTPLDAAGTAEEQEKAAFDFAKREETLRLARAEAKAEREARKQKLVKK